MLSRKSTAGYIKKAWSKEEDAILTEKATNIDSHNWNDVASYLAGRTGKQCRERWYNHLIDGGCKKGDWTTDEDLLIISCHSQLGNQWSDISKLLQFRSPNDVRNRFYQLERIRKRKESDSEQLNEYSQVKSSNSGDSFKPPSSKKDCTSALSYTKKVWSTEEDAILIDKAKIHGRKNWKLISSFLPRRTAKQCRERHHNHLLEGIKKGDWTEDEDVKIISLHLRFGNQWSKINKFLPDRSANDIKNRFKSLDRNNKEIEPALSSASVMSEYQAKNDLDYSNNKATSINSKKQSLDVHFNDSNTLGELKSETKRKRTKSNKADFNIKNDGSFTKKGSSTSSSSSSSSSTAAALLDEGINSFCNFIQSCQKDKDKSNDDDD